jgi:hypothetical protein
VEYLNPEDGVAMAKFKCVLNDGKEEVVAFNDIQNYIEKDESWDGIWKFRRIVTHKNVKKGDPNYFGCSVNVLVEWENGEKTWKPLYIRSGTEEQRWGMYNDDPVTVAIYARENKLLDTPGWKLPNMRRLAKTQGRIIRYANQAKLQSFRTKPIYMYGFLVPRNYAQAIELDKENGNTKWQDCTDLELNQIDEYQTFIDKGKGYKPGPEYKRINVHLVYAVKHDGRHKARLVAGGHLTDTPIDSVYSSVVSLRGIRLLTMIGELNRMEIWATDIGNAYLESYTKEKVYIVAGPEFGAREGHTLIISRALYGLKSSSLRWSERLADVLREMGFFPSKAGSDIWMRDCGDHYEYIAVYVDDLLIVSKRPAEITQKLTDDYKFKLKGTGPISFHLGCDFYRDDEGRLCYAPKKYIEKMLDNYKRIFGQLPKPVSAPTVKNDHPELDSSEFLDIEQTKVYQSLIGALQWVIQIGRWDITTAVMSLSAFRAAPRKGHLDRVCRIHGYLRKMMHGVNVIRTEEPDYSEFPHIDYDWTYTQYPDAKEALPDDAPRPLGKSITTGTWEDANLNHNLLSGKAVTGILHLWNKTVVDWYSKHQPTVETTTFGAESVSGRIAADQIIDLRLTAIYLGVPVKASYMFGDNESVVNATSLPHGKIHKRHHMLAFHKIRECVAAKIFRYFYVKGTTNPADILSKHWDMASVWNTLKPMMFWHGDTGKLLEEESGGSENEEAEPTKDTAQESTSESSTISSRGVINGGNSRLQSGLDTLETDEEQTVNRTKGERDREQGAESSASRPRHSSNPTNNSTQVRSEKFVGDRNEAKKANSIDSGKSSL